MAVRVSQSVLEQIRLKNDIATLIGGYFALQPNGANFKALCPFHKEKTPSFMVNPQRQIFHCFGCGAGGDVFRFVMDYEKIDFMAAVKMLAKRAGIKLDWEEGRDGSRPDKEVLYEINTAVAGLYHKLLLTRPEAEHARRYLKSRALTSKTAEEFMIGYAPDRWDTVLQWARGKYRREQLAAAGLVLNARPREEESAPSDNWHDRFRNRLMFPIHDEQGRVLGFSARALAENESAKYINTPETALFRKGNILYALHRARRAIVNAREAILCEGQIDVIRCHLAGFTTAVAAQGTAFTEEHARILKRYADGVVIIFDADRAGQDAALRAADVVLQIGLAARIAALPSGEDPDSLIRRPDGPALFRKLIDEARAALDFQIDVLASREKPLTEAGLVRLTSAVVNTIARTPNAVQQSRQIRHAADRLAVTEAALQRELGKLHSRTPKASNPVKPELVRSSHELALAEHLVRNPELAGLVRKYLPLDMLVDPACRETIRACLDAESGQDLMAVLAARDNEQRDLTGFAAQLAMAPVKVKSDFATVEESVKSLVLAIRVTALRKRRGQIEKELRLARLAASGANDAETRKMEIEYTQLGYDIIKLKHWATALPIMELSAAPMDVG